jgi:pimeloyl-ACP methyl ester carboxylesterase
LNSYISFQKSKIQNPKSKIVIMTSQTSAASTTDIQPLIGGSVATYSWQWHNQPITVAFETLGEGSPVLLLPALSTVSSRSEMADLARGLASRHQVFALDWPGFGDSSRPPLDYRPDLFYQCLSDFVQSQFSEPIMVVAAGHAAGYALRLGAQKPGVWSRMVLTSPTWRGPLSVMGAPQTMRDGVRELVRSPLVGDVLYTLNTAPAFLRWMYQRHVFVDEGTLTPDFMAQKYAITQKENARYAPAAFVTGTLDPATSREEYLGWASSLSVPLMVVIGQQSPDASKAEMESLSVLSGVETVRMRGSLGVHEESGDDIAAAILKWEDASQA